MFFLLNLILFIFLTFSLAYILNKIVFIYIPSFQQNSVLNTFILIPLSLYFSSVLYFTTLMHPQDFVLPLTNSDVVKWVSENRSNYQWTHDLWFWLQKEFWFRYDDMHDTWSNLYNKLSHKPDNIKEGELTCPPLTVASGFEVEGLEDDIQNTIEGYRNYYIKWTKDKNAKWGGIVENMRQPPNWIVEYANV